MNAKMIEASLAMLARLIPPEEYAKAVKAINDLGAIAKAFDDRLARLEKLIDRMDLLEAIVRNNVDGAEHVFAERDGWMVAGRIEKALAPAERGSLNDHRS